MIRKGSDPHTALDHAALPLIHEILGGAFGLTRDQVDAAHLLSRPDVAGADRSRAVGCGREDV